jgi:hypothetical protein
MPYEKDFEHNLLCETSGAYCAQSKSAPKLGVYSLAITDFLAFAEKKVWLSRMGIKDLDTHEHDIPSIQFYFMQLPLFKKTQEDIEGLSIREKWAYLFKYAKNTREEEIDLIAGKHTIIHKVYDVLNKNNLFPSYAWPFLFCSLVLLAGKQLLCIYSKAGSILKRQGLYFNRLYCTSRPI